MSINFAHIAPVAYLPFVQQYKVHLLLAHLVEENEEYRNFYINLKRRNPKVFYHLDNSAFEMFKRGRPMYDSNKLIKMAELVGADSIVMSDYPKEDWRKTVESAESLIPHIKKKGFKTFFCPQSQIGDLDGLMRGFEWASNRNDIDFIGVSILACPIALGINEVKHGLERRDEAFRMQRYLSRYTVLNQLNMRRVGPSRLHCLGMTEGPHEIELLRPFHDYIYSWDSSSAIWHAINGIEYDNSPTGLRYGKCEIEVDFDIALPEKFDNLSKIIHNIAVVDNLCRGDE